MGVITVFFYVFAVGCNTESTEEKEKRNIRISENAREIQKNNEGLIQLLEQGPGPTIKQ